MNLYFPMGAGGNWLRHVIHCLQTGRIKPVTDINYHVSNRYDFGITHYHSDYTKTNKHDLLFSGHCVYNFYINYIIKGLYFRERLLPNTDHYIQVIKYSYFANHSIGWHHFLQTNKPQLQWELLYTDEDKFIDDLFISLSERNIKFIPNREIVNAKIAEYKSKNIDPMISFDNPDHLFWEGWCIGYMNYHNINLTFKAGMPSRTHLLLAQAKKLDIAGKSMKYLFKTN